MVLVRTRSVPPVPLFKDTPRLKAIGCNVREMAIIKVVRLETTGLSGVEIATADGTIATPYYCARSIVESADDPWVIYAAGIVIADKTIDYIRPGSVSGIVADDSEVHRLPGTNAVRDRLELIGCPFT
jgi:hypothetical protein